MITCNHAVFVSFYFYGNLVDFLSKPEKQQPLERSYAASTSVKDAVEAIGPPHVEVGKLTVNGGEQPLSSLLSNNDRVQVYPFQKAGLQQAPQAFLLDVHLGKLARLLRMAGVDAAYQNHVSNHELVQIASTEPRVLLTRDVGLLKHKRLQYGYWLRSQDPDQQFAEVARRFSLCERFAPFSRCIACNAILEPVAKDRVAAQLPANTKAFFNDYFQCLQCKRIYWRGSHYERMSKTMERLRSLAC